MSTPTTIAPESTAKIATFAKPATTRKPRTDAKPTAVDNGTVIEPTATDSESTTTLSKLESQADKLVAAGTKTGMSLASVLCELFVREAWTAHDMPLVAYFQAERGIGENGYCLPFKARRELVTKMAELAPDAPMSALAAMSGAGVRSVIRDRSELELANPARVESHKPTDGDDDSGTDDDNEPTPAKASKTVKTINIVAVIDGLSDTQMLTAIMQHAMNRLTELTAITA